ncbi:MAG: phage tail tape measure protein [Peptostreptococcaceae bacterium]|nr:phage tail tape measure protein [Peptostreptococcaceae bacterium]
MRTIALENLYRLSLVVNMIDNLSGPAGAAQRQMNSMMQSVQSFTNASANLAKSGLAMQTFGREIAEAVLSPVQATFETRRAIGELSSLGVKDLVTLEEAAGKFSSTWAGTNKAQFITAAYDIKSGISSLTDEGIAKYTELAGITAAATKATTEEMTSLFATGYGIYKDFYSDLSDIQFAEIFSAGIAESVRAFKTSGSGMAQSIQTLGAAATSANVPLEEQFAILGMLQATMSGSEAGTKYRAFLKGAAKAGEELGLAFTDANNQLLSMPQILAGLKEKFGETIDAAEAMQLQKAFGTDEAVALINLLYEKTGDLEGNILNLHGAMGQGIDIATKMADTINQEPGQQYVVLMQQIQGLKEEIGTQLLPTVIEWMGKAKETIADISNWVKENQGLVQTLMTLALYFGIGITALGSFNMAMGAGGMLIGKTIGNFMRLGDLVTSIPGAFARIPGMLTGGISAIRGGFETIYLHGLYAKDALVRGALAVKGFALSLLSMAKNAIITGAQALPGLIASVWSFTTALFANPITWIILGVIALAGALYLLYQHWEEVTSFVSGAWTAATQWIVSTFEWIKSKVSELPAGFQILLAAIFPIIGIPALLIANWESITGFFSTLWTSILTSFQTGIDNIKGFLDGVFTWFYSSGERIMTTFTDGIKNMAMAPVEAVKGALAKIRKHLPFSDAKEGPLSTLTLSGTRVFSTITEGMDKTKDLPANKTEEAFRQMNLSAKKQTFSFESMLLSFGKDWNMPDTAGWIQPFVSFAKGVQSMIFPESMKHDGSSLFREPAEEKKTVFDFEVGNKRLPSTGKEIEKHFTQTTKEEKISEASSSIIIQNQELHFDKIAELNELIHFLTGLKKVAETGGGTLH